MYSNGIPIGTTNGLIGGRNYALVHYGNRRGMLLRRATWKVFWRNLCRPGIPSLRPWEYVSSPKQLVRVITYAYNRAHIWSGVWILESIGTYCISMSFRIRSYRLCSRLKILSIIFLLVHIICYCFKIYCIIDHKKYSLLNIQYSKIPLPASVATNCSSFSTTINHNHHSPWDHKERQ